MTKRTRTILFFVCVLLFVIVSPSLLLYTQGYRFDWQKKSLSQTGGFCFKVAPKQAEVYLDGKLAKKTDFFFGSALIENLLPKTYEIEIKKEGFHAWKKNLEVKEKEVNETKTIVLFPENPKFSSLTKGIKQFWLSSDKKNLILRESEKGTWTLKLYETDKNLKSHLISEKDISQSGAELMSLESSQNKNEMSLEVGATERKSYFTLALDKTPPALTENDAPEAAKKYFLAYEFSNNDVYYLDGSGDVFKANPSLTSKQKLNERPFPVKQETDYRLQVFSGAVFLQEEKTLYNLNPDSKSFEKLFEETEGVVVSPDSNKLAVFSNYEIWVFFIKDGLPRKKAGDKAFLLRLSEKIDGLVWLNSDYMAFIASDSIKICEADERDKVNVIELSQFKDPKILWSGERKEMFVLSEETLYRSEKLIQ